MRDAAFAFLLAAALSASLGMAWGIQMGISGDHLMAPAHAHLNLVGFVTLSLFGLYHRLTPQVGARLAWAHAALAIPGAALMVGGMALLFSGGTEAVAIVGSLLTLGSMLLFLVILARHGFGAPRREPSPGPHDERRGAARTGAVAA